MKILLHSFTFSPNVGGVESVSHNLAVGFTARGHEVTIVTETEADSEPAYPYRVVRNPSLPKAAELISEHDIVHVNGASVRYFSTAERIGKPFIWTQVAYQLQSIDGFGWAAGAPAPLKPIDSFVHHARLFGPLTAGAGMLKLLARRRIATRVQANVAISHHQAMLQSLPYQEVIYNPVDWHQFSPASERQPFDELGRADTTFTYLGRLISEKGVNDLIKALAFTRNGPGTKRDYTLKIIGDGPERARLEQLATDLGVGGATTWVGELTGEALAAEIRRSGIFVLPSAWEEPMGIVAVELMGAGKPLVVSRVGGVSECAGEAGLTFANRNHDELAMVMTDLAENLPLQHKLIERSLRRVKSFDPAISIERYLDLFSRHLKRG